MAAPLGLAVLLVLIGILLMAVLPGAGLVIGVILLIVAVGVIGSAVRRGRSAA
jgi:hypothetical protein